MRILVLGDSPTLTSGFACVLQNLLTRWVQWGAQVDVWGICYDGTPHTWPFRIWPGGDGPTWMLPKHLNKFLERLATGDYTHVFILQDTFQLSQRDFPKKLREALENKGVAGQPVRRDKPVRCVYYFPVDATLDPKWTEIMRYVDLSVAYTEQGQVEAEAAASRAGWKLDCAVVPHGVDADLFQPWPEDRRRENRRLMHRDVASGRYFLNDDDFVVINVNQHQRRKDFPRTLEVFAEFKERVGRSAKLILHCAKISSDGTDLDAVAEQLGLRYFEDYVHHGEFFDRGMGLFGREEMPALYNVADCYLTTTLGEGWGLGITEALACGLPCVVPAHTACVEIFRQSRKLGSDRIRAVPCTDRGVLPQDNSRWRPRTDVRAAADALESIYRTGAHRTRPALPEALRHWLDWGRIAGEMLGHLQGVQAPARAGEAA